MPNQRSTLVTLLVVLLLAGAAAAWWKLSPRKAAGPVEYAMLVPTDIPTSVAAAPDGSIWFTIDFGEGVGLVRDGKVQRVPKAGGRNVEPIGLGVDATGAAWVTDPSKIAVARVTAEGEMKSFPLGTPVARLARLAVAPDGAVWFAESTAFSITRLKDGKLDRHEFKSLRGGPYGVAVAADGTVWATLQSGNQLLRITPSGEMTEYDLPTPSAAPTDVAVDRQGGVWVVEFSANKIARFVDGKFTEYPLPKDKAAPSGIAVAADGSVWFGVLRGAALGRLHEGQMTFHALPRPTARPYSVTADAAGNVWYADISGYVGMVPGPAK
jgi:virginiamycin B lyase